VPSLPPIAVPASIRRRVAAHLRPTLAQLVRDLVADEFDGEAQVSLATAVLLTRLSHMAPHLGGGMVAMTLVFDLWCRAAGGPYAQQSAYSRQRLLDQWRALPGPLGGWAQFYEKMGVFSYWAVVEDQGGGHGDA